MDMHKQHLGLTMQIIIAMLLGITIGLILHSLPESEHVNLWVIDGVLDIGGKIFIIFLKMLVVPIVFVSLVCGVCNLDDAKKFGRLATKTIILYILTTAVAITIALIVANSLKIGSGGNFTTATAFNVQELPSMKQTLLNIFPSNPFAALASGNMLQIIVFAILFGMAITWSGKSGQKVRELFIHLDVIIMKMMDMVLKIAPYGVFCLVATIFARIGFTLIGQLFRYFATVLLVLFIHLFITYPVMLRFLARLSPLRFFRKLFPAMLFAFSTSSSNASIPVVLSTVETKLGVRESIAAFIIPLGATINMDGTAIMQGVATVFIANAYSIHIGLAGFLKVILTATLASVGTAGIPSAGLITLTMVLIQVGLPVEGIALIIGVDRLLDMTRTAVNICGDSTIACVVAKSEQAIDLDIYNQDVVENAV